jgi:hypothetical protein
MQATRSIKMSVGIYQTELCHIQDDNIITLSAMGILNLIHFFISKRLKYAMSKQFVLLFCDTS